MVDNILKQTKFYKEIPSPFEKGSLFMNGFCENLKLLTTCALFKNQDSSYIYIEENELIAKKTYEKLKDLLGEEDVLYFSSTPNLFYLTDAHSMEIIKNRVRGVKAGLLNEKKIIVTSIDAILQRSIFFEKEDISSYKLEDIINLKDFMEKLKALGYEAEEEVVACGTYQIRGGIIDLFVMGENLPFRIELFDDEIDSIRTFDPLTKKSIDSISSFKLLPGKDNIISRKDITLLKEEVSKIKKSLLKKDFPEDIKDNFSMIFEKIENDTIDIDNFLYLLVKEKHKSFIDLFQNPVIFLKDPNILKKAYKDTLKTKEENLKLLLERGKILPFHINKHFSYSYFEDILLPLRSVVFFDFLATTCFLKGEKIINVKSINNENYHKNIKFFMDTLLNYKKNDYKVIIAYMGQKEKKTLENLFSTYNIDTIKEHKNGYISLWESPLTGGVDILGEKIFIASYKDIIAGEKKKRKNKKLKKKDEEAFFAEIVPGDYVVHEDYGIGKYIGLKHITTDNIENDYLEIEYALEDKVFVAVGKMHLVSKYIGHKDAPPKLNKLGGTSWENTKNKTKAAIRDLAKEYLYMYAKRSEIKGYSFKEDTPWQEEFESKFEFTLTEDQEKCIRDVKRDMEKDTPMDRLICGDVGFGKTEVAIRAIFKACMEGKQVALLVPTTVLALQHYNTIIERFRDFPINVDMLSRFKSKAEQSVIINKLKLHKIDVIIATHKILNDSVTFGDLGLLIVDEEQRFGVAHKDKLKLLKENVDTLSLSATPIPRTLNMSLSGIRDLSTIETPPINRFETQTFVLEYDDMIIKDAILRELARGGQVFFIYNNVKNIEKIVGDLQKLIPGARVSYAHGQMSETLLEKRILSFLNREYDILVSTTIVENGLNILNANTIIIKEANNLGLSQLYQLRGRVGRSDKPAYAYVTYEKNKVLNENATKRLKAINEFTKFGCGFKVAIRDLQIRGAGSILGANQHGHFAKVGYEMYTKLLKEGLLLEKGKKVEILEDTIIDININAFIPKSFIKEEKNRITTYKQISSISTREEKEDYIDTLIDIYGDVPKETLDLIEVALLRNKARKKRIYRIALDVSKTNLYIEYKKDYELDMEKINEIDKQMNIKISMYKDFIRLSFKLDDKKVNILNHIPILIEKL